MTDYHGNSVQTRKQRSSNSIKLKTRLMRLTVPIWKKSIWIKLLILSFLPSVDLQHSTKYHKELSNATRYTQKAVGLCPNSLETNKKVKLFSWLISLRNLSYFKATWFKHQMIMKVRTQRTGTLLTQQEMSSTLFKMKLKKADSNKRAIDLKVMVSGLMLSLSTSNKPKKKVVLANSQDSRF